MNRPPSLFILAAAACFLTAPLTPLAGPGHDHGAPGAGGPAGEGPLFLSAAQRANLQMMLGEARIASRAPTVDAPAVLVVPPENLARISAPFEGRIDEVLVKLGQHVDAGDPVLRVSPLAVGSPAQTLRAPASGHVTHQYSRPGMIFSPRDPLLELGDDTRLLARGLIFQGPALQRIQLGRTATFRVDALPEESFSGTLQRLDTGHDPADLGFHLYALLENPDRRLKPNFRGILSLPLDAPRPMIVVPRRAILGTLGEQFVFVQLDDDHFERRDVVLGDVVGDEVEIIEGVLPGDRVVTRGNYQLQYIQPEGDPADAPTDPHAGHNH